MNDNSERIKRLFGEEEDVVDKLFIEDITPDDPGFYIEKKLDDYQGIFNGANKIQ